MDTRGRVRLLADSFAGGFNDLINIIKRKASFRHNCAEFVVNRFQSLEDVFKLFIELMQKSFPVLIKG